MKLKYLIFICFLLLGLQVKAQPLILGTTSEGGSAFGTIFNQDINYQNFNTTHSFSGISGSNPIYTTLVEANNGLLYGLTSKGGKFDQGVLFSYHTQTKVYTTWIHFNKSDIGAEPRGSLIKTSDGNLWGMCSVGGKNNAGTLFVFNPTTNSLTKKHDLSSSNGSAPFGNLCQFNQKLYGITYQGGASNLGVLFSYNTQNDSFTKIIDFNGTNGQNPFGSLILANNNKLYGMTYQGGTFGQGIIFEFNPQNDSFKKKKDFNSSITGSNPYGNLLQAQNGNFYGMTFLGGANNNGSIFEYNLQNDSLKGIFSFSSSLGTGQNPYGNLIELSNGRFLGTTIQGGSNNGGTLFEWNNHLKSYQILHSFSNSLNGRNPQGSLIKHSNGNLYGLTNRGGQTSFGVLFEWDTLNKTMTKRIDLNIIPNGGFPLSNLSEFSMNYELYGTSSNGGNNNSGTIYQLNLEQQKYNKLHDFNSITDGANPQCQMTEASNNKFYGVALNGGSQNSGTLFEYNPKDSVFTKKIDFDGLNLGKNPYSKLSILNDSILFGMTSIGGIDDYGVIYKYNVNQNTIQKVLDFDDTFSGSNPLNSMFLASDNVFYGTTFSGGQNELGVLFKFNPSTLSFEKLIDFNGFGNGSYPQSSLIEIDNKLYGTTRFGGNNNDGVLYEFNLQNSSLTILQHFEDSIGIQPTGELLNLQNKTISGTCFLGGKNGVGSIFEYQLNNQKLSAKHHFNIENGSKPMSGLIKTCIPFRDTIHISTCDTFKLYSGKRYVTVSSIFNDTLISNLGCDSILTIHLTIRKSSSSTLNAEVCQYYTDPLGESLDSSGVYIYRISNYLGCDSVITLNLKVKNSSSFHEYTTCDTFIAANGTVYKTSGNYTVTIPNYLNCDSTIHFNLKVLKSNSQLNIATCFNYQLPNGIIVDTSGIYKVTIKNYRNCDSLITCIVDITKPNLTITYNNSELVSLEDNCTYQWYNCETKTAILNANNKEFKPLVNGRYAVIINKNNCIDTSNCVVVNNLKINEKLITDGMIHLYPNPNNGIIQIEAINNPLFKAVLYNCVGKEIKTFNLTSKNKAEINITEYENGVYFIKIESLNKTTTFKINKIN
jgi:uncharacterized repeat protein (TIGR03803 family)